MAALGLLPALLALFALFSVPEVGGILLAVSVDDQAIYNVTLDGAPYLRSAPVTLRANGKLYSSADGSLTLLNVTKATQTGPFGLYHSYVMLYQADDVTVTATIRDYELNFISFTLMYETAANQTSTNNFDDVISGFPGFHIETALKELGYISYGGPNLGVTDNVAGKWAPGETTLRGGLQGSAPLAVFDKKGTTVVVSALDNFLSTSMWQDPNAHSVQWGIMGGVDSVPQGFAYSTVLTCDDGIGSAFNVWGFILANTFYKANDSEGTGCDLDKVGYWTDKNWTYYGKPNGTYQDTVIGAAAAAVNGSIPLGYIQLDDWWYIRGKGNGVKDWDAPPAVFPNGVQSINNDTHLPLAVRADVWSSDTVYAKQNGGRYDFVLEGDYAIPNDETFWDELLSSAKAWGLSVLDQESMSDQLSKMNATRQDLFLSRDWMRHLGAALVQNDVSVVFGGATPRQAMQVLDLGLPHPVRAEGDEQREEGYGSIKIRQQVCTAFRVGSWRIGVTSLWARALPIQPMVDVYQTRNNISGLPPRLLSLVASLTGGPIGIGDAMGNTERTLLIRGCGVNGKIMYPNVPAAAIDSQILKMAFGGEGPDGEVWSTLTSVPVTGMAADTALVYGVVFAVITGSYQVTLKDARMDFQFSPSKVFSYKDPRRMNSFDAQTPLLLQGCSLEDFCLHYIVPVITFQNKEVLILGELDKWIPVSQSRVKSVQVTKDQIIITMTVPPKERVELWFWVDGQVGALARIADDTGDATLIYETYSAVSRLSASGLLLIAATLASFFTRNL